MKKATILNALMCLGFVLPSCYGDSDSSSTSSTPSDDCTSNDASASDACPSKDASGTNDGTTETDESADSAPEGPWVCVGPTEAVNRETGVRKLCGYKKCLPGIGCGSDFTCENNDDCIETTLEIGWDVPTRVYCDIDSICHCCEIEYVPDCHGSDCDD